MAAMARPATRLNAPDRLFGPICGTRRVYSKSGSADVRAGRGDHECRMSGEMPNWELKLARVVVPIRSEPLRTLSDARAYILALPPGTRHQDEWERAADLLMAAVDSSSETDIEQATFQIERALLFHKLLAPR
jgi:hypothetical protein